MRNDNIWWATSVVFFLFGDIITTGIGLHFELIAESGYIAKLLLNSNGVFTMLVLLFMIKGVLMFIFFMIWGYVDDYYGIGIPLGLTVVGVYATLNNIFIILYTILQ